MNQPTLPGRFWAKATEDQHGCWIWNAATNNRGYGVTSVAGRLYLAHRAAYEELMVEIPEGLTIDHLCRVRRCINPWHLEPVSTRVNNARSQPERACGPPRRQPDDLGFWLGYNRQYTKKPPTYVSAGGRLWGGGGSNSRPTDYESAACGRMVSMRKHVSAGQSPAVVLDTSAQ